MSLLGGSKANRIFAELSTCSIWGTLTTFCLVMKSSSGSPAWSANGLQCYQTRLCKAKRCRPTAPDFKPHRDVSGQLSHAACGVAAHETGLVPGKAALFSG